jgi:hypothetical protein
MARNDKHQSFIICILFLGILGVEADVRKFFLLFVSLITVLLLAVACNGMVSQQEYNKVADDLAAEKAEIESLNNRVNQANNDLADAFAKTVRAKREVTIFNSLFIPALNGEMYLATDEEQSRIIKTIEKTIEDIGDKGLSEKYRLMKSSGDSDATAGFFIYLLQDLEETLKQ